MSENLLKTEISITDDFDLYKIADCGQCFRGIKIGDDDTYRFITKKNVLYIRKTADNKYGISCSDDEFTKIWSYYFDLERSYSSIRSGIAGSMADSVGSSEEKTINVYGNDKVSNADGFLERAMDYGKGLRILRQEPFEMLISFIISQRKSIPAIRSSIEKLCNLFGEKIETELGEVRAFPEPFALSKASEEELSSCGLGYRVPYIIDAVRQVVSGELDLEALRELSDEELVKRLLEIKGVGIKVANCVSLFGYSRTGRAPVDVWIQKVIDEEYDGENPFSAYGNAAGIVQQYMFFYKKNMQQE